MRARRYGYGRLITFALTCLGAWGCAPDPKSPIAQEFPRMVELGMTPMAAIKSATSIPAEMLDMAGQIGVIAPGAYADVIAVATDPLLDIKALEKVVFVMKDGKVFKSELR